MTATTAAIAGAAAIALILILLLVLRRKRRSSSPRVDLGGFDAFTTEALTTDSKPTKEQRKAERDRAAFVTESMKAAERAASRPTGVPDPAQDLAAVLGVMEPVALTTVDEVVDAELLDEDDTTTPVDDDTATAPPAPLEFPVAADTTGWMYIDTLTEPTADSVTTDDSADPTTASDHDDDTAELVETIDGDVDELTPVPVDTPTGTGTLEDELYNLTQGYMGGVYELLERAATESTAHSTRLAELEADNRELHQRLADSTNQAAAARAEIADLTAVMADMGARHLTSTQERLQLAQLGAEIEQARIVAEQAVRRLRQARAALAGVATVDEASAILDAALDGELDTTT